MSKNNFCLEELEIVKLHDAELKAEASSEFDVLYNQTRQKIEADEEQKEAESDSGDESITETPEESDEASEAPPTRSETAAAALESFLIHHAHYDVAQEGLFDAEKIQRGMEWMGGQVGAALGYMKAIGIKYGPIVAKKLYKGVIEVIGMTSRALVAGSASLKTYVKRRMYSYSRLKEKIAAIKETINLIEDEKEIQQQYTNEKIIHKLSIEDSTDVVKNIQVAQQFYQDYFSHLATNVNGSVITTKRLALASAHASNNSEEISLQLYEKMTFPHFVQKNNDLYKPSSSCVSTYLYEKTLPGNVNFIGFLPLRVSEREEIMEAQTNARCFIGLSQLEKTSPSSLPYLSKKDLLEFVVGLEKICDYGIETEFTFKKIIRLRDEIKDSVSYMVRFLLTAQRKVSLKNSLAEFVSVKVQYIDHTSIAGSLYISDYMTQLVNAGLSFAKDNVKQLS